MSSKNSFVLVLTFVTIFKVSPVVANELETYIVHLSPPENLEVSQPQALKKWYYSLLSKIDSNENWRMVHSYRHVLIGFATKMTAEQVKAAEKMDEVLAVRRDSIYELHTTRTPHFIGLRQNSGFWESSNYGEGIIIGVLDGGITPGHPSFSDKGISSPPAKWKGKCEVAGCNNKLIGMKNFSNGSAVDEDGHGTHTSSTAAGNYVENANVLGNANGTAVGIAPRAHLAMYKVCSLNCYDSDILAGMDEAIEDGVDVISISLGGGLRNFYQSSIAIGAFTAIQKGIFVSCSAGNAGPGDTSLSNEAPWILTVGASTVDRNIRTTVKLGNGKFLNGQSLYQPKSFNQAKLRPLIYPGMTGDYKDALCTEELLKKFDVKGKVVLCDLNLIQGNVYMGQVVKAAGGAALIVANDAVRGATIPDEAHVLPASRVGYREGVQIKKYLNSTLSPLATILFKGTVLGVRSAPQVTCFTSRGPNWASPGILKPDILGPGLNILAAWPEPINDRAQARPTFNIISGTSMSCPHLSGTAALLKSAHPEWSPAAIKSAIMTTASQVSLNGRPIFDERDRPADVFAIGAGHVNPSKANDPGLVFDIEPDDYIPYLCGLKDYTSKQVSIIVKKQVSCAKTIPESHLNYPSFSVILQSGETKSYPRTVTNVGDPNSTYQIGSISLPAGIRMSVRVENQELRFQDLNRKLTYELQFTRDRKTQIEKKYDEGYMTWVSGKYTVRTPFSFHYE